MRSSKLRNEVYFVTSKSRGARAREKICHCLVKRSKHRMPTNLQIKNKREKKKKLCIHINAKEVWTKKKSISFDVQPFAQNKNKNKRKKNH
jgi:hypothetical protein